MTETSTTTDAADLIRVIGELPASQTPRPSIQVNWHDCDETALRAIMAAFPDAGWRPAQNGSTEWISGRIGRVCLTAFASDPDPKPASRIASIFTAEQVSA